MLGEVLKKKNYFINTIKRNNSNNINGKIKNTL